MRHFLYTWCVPLVIALLVVGALLASWLYWPRSARAPYRQATDVELFTSRRTTLTRVFVAVSEGLSSAAGGRPAARNSITAVTLGLELKAAPGPNDRVTIIMQGVPRATPLPPSRTDGLGWHDVSNDPLPSCVADSACATPTPRGPGLHAYTYTAEVVPPQNGAPIHGTVNTEIEFYGSLSLARSGSYVLVVAPELTPAPGVGGSNISHTTPVIAANLPAGVSGVRYYPTIEHSRLIVSAAQAGDDALSPIESSPGFQSSGAARWTWSDAQDGSFLARDLQKQDSDGVRFLLLGVLLGVAGGGAIAIVPEMLRGLGKTGPQNGRDSSTGS